MNKRQIPNYLTYARIIGILPVCLLLMADAAWATWLAFFLYVALAVTDWFDGYLARLWDVNSEIGRFLDPIADKLLVAAVFVPLIANGTIAGLFLLCPILILLREFFVAGLREFVGPKNVVVHVTQMAKLKTTAQLIACGILILAPVADLLVYLGGQAVLMAATVLTLASGWDYWRQVAPHFKEGA